MSLDWLDSEIDKLAGVKLYRQRTSRSGRLGCKIVVDGKRYISFASNDYLGIASDPALQSIVEKTVLRGGWGSGSSPLIVGRSAMHAELERRLATFFQRDAAILFPTGFAANTGTIPTLVGKQDVIFSDAKNHASIIDGCRLSGARIVIYPHADVNALASLLQAEKDVRRRLIVTDGLFSMDGDVAPIAALAKLKTQFDAMLMVDEAHALGVLGPQARGVANMAEADASVDVLVGTLSKAFGSHGGFVAGSRKLIDYLANRARSYVFSTAAPVAASAVALTALGIVRDEPKRREKLLALSALVREQLSAHGWDTGCGSSHIVPVILEETQRAIAISQHVKEQGYWVPCIRPPTVPVGESLLRISITSNHTEAMVEGLVGALREAAKRDRSV